jgi:hypothetical protein
MSIERKIKRAAKKSDFQKALEDGAKVQRDAALTTEQRKEERYEKLEKIFQQLGDKKNRYLLYCPDIPFPCSLVKIIYEHAHYLNQMGFNAVILHEVKGYRPNWLQNIEVLKSARVIYLSEKKKTGGYSKPAFSFSPTDTIVIPEGFWTVMTGFAETKTLHKVVMAFGYGGFATAEPGANWASLGFTDVLCMSDNLKEDYSKLWPNLKYHSVGYDIDRELFSPLDDNLRKPEIALSCRSREDAQSIINIFYSKYPFLDMFQFKILKKLDTNEYANALRQSAVMVFSDEKAGSPAPPLEAIACGVPTIGVFGRGMENLVTQDGMIWLPTNDPFTMVEAIAEYCINWLENNVKPIEDKAILDLYNVDVVKTKLLNVYEELQMNKIKLFGAVKTAVDEGKLNEAVLDTMPTDFKADEVKTVEQVIADINENK